MIKYFHVGMKGVIRHPKDDRVLLMKMHNGAWDLPGGRLDEGERGFEETLTRELHEELPGIRDVTIGRQLGAVRMAHDLGPRALEQGVDTSMLPGGGVGLVIVLYDVRASLPDPVQVSDEHASFAWTTRAAAAEAFPHASHLFVPQ